ncbi:MAG: crossover junction endodeoxyribonuclease RuvC [Actinomycetota bacterium]|jgi:crossover junction endodeoxyribonuclease RuvC|nr:crossover junction endodeoxyribonuclease RuvC [Actinomycetota bacterium]
MRVLGIDPGFATTGFAVVAKEGSRLNAISLGAIVTPPKLPTASRLSFLRAQLLELIDQHQPEVVAIERLFFNVNVRTAMAVGQASGVALEASASSGLEVHNYTPLEVKQSVVGVGNATKHQVQTMVTALLGLESVPKPPDAADACALCICHLNRSGLARALEAALR